MKKLIIYTILISTASVFSSCKKFLERSPYDKIDASLFFKSEKDLELYANGFIQRNIPSYQTLTYGDQYADYLASMKSTSYLTGAFTADDQGGWDESSWAELRNINYFLDNIKKAEGIVDEATYRHYVGVGRFWRAWFYYAKVKNFGDVPWYETSIESSDEEQLKKPRDSREFVMNKVLEDITCPFCKSPAAVEIRASLFGEDFTYNLFISILPFLVFSIIIYLIYHGGIPYKKRNKL